MQQTGGSCATENCQKRLTTSGRWLPVMVDDDGRPYCRDCAGKLVPDYITLLHAYDDFWSRLNALVASGYMTAQDAAAFW
jgi:hypothetical protein